MKVKIYFDNLVTDDVITETRECFDLEAADVIAYELSKRTGLSAGNYETCILLRGGYEINTVYIDMAGSLTKASVLSHATRIAKDAAREQDHGLAMALCEMLSNWNAHHGSDQIFYVWGWKNDRDFYLRVDKKEYRKGRH